MFWRGATKIKQCTALFACKRRTSRLRCYLGLLRAWRDGSVASKARLGKAGVGAWLLGRAARGRGEGGEDGRGGWGWRGGGGALSVRRLVANEDAIVGLLHLLRRASCG